MFLCPWRPNTEAGPEQVGVRGSGDTEHISERVSLRKVHGPSVTIAAKAEWEPFRAFLLDAEPCLFARMKAASRTSADLGREGKGFQQTHSFPRSIRFCDVVSTFHAHISRGSRAW